jgi:hypothetical protein
VPVNCPEPVTVLPEATLMEDALSANVTCPAASKLSAKLYWKAVIWFVILPPPRNSTSELSVVWMMRLLPAEFSVEKRKVPALIVVSPV